MRVNERLLVLSVISCGLALSQEKVTPRPRKPRHFLALLGYIHGYRLGQDYALQFPQYLISPVIVLPSVNQQQSVNVQKGGTEDNYQENGGISQSIASAKVILSNITSPEKEMKLKEFKNNLEKNDITQKKENEILDATLRQLPLKENKTTDMTVAIVTNNSNTENMLPDKLNLTKPLVSNSTTTNNKTETDPKPSGPYASAKYDNDKVNSLTITTPIPEELFELPPVSDNRWQNFTLKANLTISDKNKTNDVQNNSIMSTVAIGNVTEHPKETSAHYKGPYPNALYNNAMIEQLSITTNSYTNGESSSQYNRWGGISSLTNAVSKPDGFKPLAGLYYDGYLHKPLKKYEFLPQNLVNY